MAERYTKLYAPGKNLYCPGSPLIICAGSLLSDSYTKNMLAQIKYKNISDKTVRAVRVSIEMHDSEGLKLGESVEYSYLDLSVPRDGEFGQKSAVVLTEDEVRSFNVTVNEVLFEDGSKWLWDQSPWEPLKTFATLADSFQDAELAEQYKIRYGSDCLYKPMETGDLWLCTCGGVNHSSERSCHLCRRVFTALMDVNINSLRQECADRLKTEGEQNELAEADNSDKKKKSLKIAAIAVPVLIIAILLLCFVPGASRNSKAYAAASELLTAGDYDGAQEGFAALGDYKDSAVMASSEVPYHKACAVMNAAAEGDIEALELISVAKSSLGEGESPAVILYEGAANLFDKLGDYKDSAALAADCRSSAAELSVSAVQAEYDAAMALMDEGSYCLARDAFELLGDFEDSALMAQEAIYRKAVALFSFMQKNDVRDVFASFSTETGVDSLIYIAEDKALAKGDDFIPALKTALGKDTATFGVKEQPKGLIPFPQALSKLFSTLGDYKDSKDYPARIEIESDYTREFFALANEGRLAEARDWLAAYDGEFEGREEWLQLLELYIPFCTQWELYSGGRSVVAASAGSDADCGTINSVVIISDTVATLRITIAGAEDVAVEFTAETGNNLFSCQDEYGSGYVATINVNGRLAFNKVSGTPAAAEYKRVG